MPTLDYVSIFAQKLANAFPSEADNAPSNNWLSKLIKAWVPDETMLKRNNMLNLNWNPKIALAPGTVNGMFTTRVACLLASAQTYKAEELLRKLDERERFHLAGEASCMILLANNDALAATTRGDSRTFSVSACMMIAAYFEIMHLADAEGFVEFPIRDWTFKGRIAPNLDMPTHPNDTDGIGTALMHIVSRIEAFTNISANCAIHGALDETIDPADLFSDDAISVPSMPMALLISKVPQQVHINWGARKNPNLTTFLPTVFNQALPNAFMPLEHGYLAIVPETLPHANGIRLEALANKSYDLWPGVSEIQWQEGAMRCLRLLPMPSGEIFSVLRFYSDDETEAKCFFERLMTVPALDDETSWEDYVKDADRDPKVGRTLSPMLEAIRMCVAPTEVKIRDGRVPSGYVNGTRKPSPRKGDIPIIYLPKIRTITERSDDSELSAPTGITHRGHQVSGFLRQLKSGWKASDTARISAERFGIKIPESGYTFVRPHTRGSFTGEKRIYRVSKKGHE
jgi:hypothetical protein